MNVIGEVFIDKTVSNKKFIHLYILNELIYRVFVYLILNCWFKK